MRRLRRLLVAITLLLFTAGGSLLPCAEAQGEASAKTLVVRAASYLDVEAGRLIEPAVLVVRGDRIEAVNPRSLPEGAEVLDLGSLTLLPGLIDLHTHLAYELGPGWVYRPVTEDDPTTTLRGAAHARRTVEAGFTTVRDLGSRGFVDVALEHAVDKGWIEGPRVFPVGHPVSITGGHCDTTGFAPGIGERDYRSGVADGPDEVVKAVRYQIKHGARWIKICATAGVLSFEGTVGAQQMTEAEMRAAVEEAARHGIKVAAHAHGDVGILAAVRAGVASIEHGSILTDEVIAAMKEHGTYLVPTTYLADAIDLDTLPPPVRAKAEEILPKARESLRRAIASGVKIAFGTDAAVYPHGLNARELGVLVKRGMSPLEALRTATLYAADLLEVSDRGVIARGRLADLVAVQGNPLEDVTLLEDVRFVMLGGSTVVLKTSEPRKDGERP